MPVDSTRRPLIVIADDEQIIRDLLRRRLELEGYEVEAAEDGEEAVAKVGHVFVNVILSDIKMPGLDGIEVLKRTKAVSPDTEVIMMTAYASTETAIEAVRLGAYDYLQKPFEHIDEVVHKVKMALRQQRLELQNREMIKKLDEMNRGLKQVVMSRTRELKDAQDMMRQGPLAECAARMRERLDGVVVEIGNLRKGDGPQKTGALGEIERLVGELRTELARLGEVSRPAPAASK